VLIVNPGGTGKPIEAISARLAPLPPRRARIAALPSVCWPKAKTYFFPAFDEELRFEDDLELFFIT
jgi:hypothetical protein